MPTVWEYADHVAAGDTGYWRAATRRAAQVIDHRHPEVDHTRQIPMVQTLLQTAALLTYALARSNGEDPTTVCVSALHRWAAEHAVPQPPPADSSSNSAHWIEGAQRWRRDLDTAVDRQRRDLGELLRHAGHDVPAAAARGLHRYSPDPVVLVWLDLADIDPPLARAQVGTYDHYPAPRLALGVAALNDIA